MKNYVIVIKDYIQSKRFNTSKGVRKLETINGCTKIYVFVDQAALHSILRQIRDMGLILLSVNLINNEKKE